MNFFVVAAGAGDSAEQNLLLPATYDIVWSLVALGIIALGFKFLLPKFQAVLDERASLIEGGLENAERVQAEADELIGQQRRLLAEARAEAAQIREQARAESHDIVAEAREQAIDETAARITAAKRQIEAERQQAMVSLRTDVATLATDLASKIVGEALDDHVRQSRVVDRFLDDLEKSTLSAASGKDS